MRVADWNTSNGTQCRDGWRHLSLLYTWRRRGSLKPFFHKCKTIGPQRTLKKSISLSHSNRKKFKNIFKKIFFFNIFFRCYSFVNQQGSHELQEIYCTFLKILASFQHVHIFPNFERYSTFSIPWNLLYWTHDVNDVWKTKINFWVTDLERVDGEDSHLFCYRFSWLIVMRATDWS